MKRIARVFPRRTKATPVDALAFVGGPPLGFSDEVDEVHVSVAFSWDLKTADRLARLWKPIARVKIGGPATGERGGEFVPGRYVRAGYVITSRGCPNACWFCSVWKREGRTIRELPIRDGLNVLDDNLLACSREHVERVFAMLRRVKSSTKGAAVQFTGGLEAARLEEWHARALRDLRPAQVFFAYDTPDDLAPLQRAGDLMLGAGFTRAGHRLRAYVLVGGPRDTFEAAERRIAETLSAGFVPMAMVYRDTKSGTADPAWRRWAKSRARPAIMFARKGKR